MIDRRTILAAMAGAMAAQGQPAATRYVRYRRGDQVGYGVQRVDNIFPIEGDLFGRHTVSSGAIPLGEVKLLYPCEPRKVLAVGLNYKSHLGNSPTPPRPEMFYKPISALQNPGDPIVIPEGATNVHYEGEMVLVIGAELRQASESEAAAGIFGVTCGNDVSERVWQNGPQKDLQWWRAKGADTFGPLGPAIVKGLDPDKLLLQTRLNGKVVQKQSTSDLVYGSRAIVSFVSQYVTLWPGDVIYTGTPGSTAAMKPGDVVEVELEGVGVLSNPVRAA